ncbi:MAG: 2-oxo acid dehydrogenase subunit E2 [Sedimentisphaerales bacterium]|jgi:pyruvate dehydrogenase E2 component (dihydrolipoamide acetyltransferase)
MKTLMHQIPLTRIQKLISRRMLVSKWTKPCFYIESKADVTGLMAIRPRLRKSLGIRITTNAFYIHALGLAAQRFSLAVGRFEGECIRLAEQINVGFAVNAPQGLVVPVIREAHKKTLSEIARLEKVLTDKARDNELTLEEMEGETIALSNLGAYGIDSFLSIVPPPACTILSVGNVVPAVVCRDGEMTVRKLLSMSLAVDRRIISETYAAEFMTFIKDRLEDPQQLT